MKTKTNSIHLWRRYRITHVTVAWQETRGNKWTNHTKVLTQERFVRRYSQRPPPGVPEFEQKNAKKTKL